METCQHGLRAGSTVIVERVVKIEYAVDIIGFKWAAILAGIDDNYLIRPAFPSKTGRHIRHGGGAVDADMQQLDAVLCKQRHQAERVAGDIRHFSRNGFAPCDCVKLIYKGEAVVQCIRIQQLCVRGEGHSVRRDIAGT